MKLFLILALIFFLIIALLNLEWALLLIIALLPSYLIRFQIFSIPSTFLETSILLVFIIWLIKATRLKPITWFKKRKERWKYPFRLEITLLLVVAYLATWRAGFSWEALGILKAYFFEPVLLFILILNILPGKKGREKIIFSLLVGALATAGLAIVQKISALFIFNPSWADIETRRVVSWFGYPNAVGLFLGPSVLLFISYLIKLFKKEVKSNKDWLLIILNAITIALSCLAIYFARSEGAMVGIILAIFISLILINRRTRFSAILILALTLFLVFLSPLRTSLSEPVQDRIFLRTLSGEIRKQQWRETWQSFQGSAMFLGHGLSAYQSAISPFHQEGIFFNRDKMDNFHSILYGSAELRDKYWQPVEIYLYPHNIALNFWSELGILGLLLFIFIFLKFIKISYQLFKGQGDYIALGLLGAILVIIVHGLVDVPYFKNDLSALFFIFLALLSSLMVERDHKLN